MRTVGTYKYYLFKDKNPIIDRLRTILKDFGWSYQKLAEETGLSYGCVWGLFEGATIDPRHSTAARIALAFGRADMALAEEIKPKLKSITGGKKSAA